MKTMECGLIKKQEKQYLWTRKAFYIKIIILDRKKYSKKLTEQVKKFWYQRIKKKFAEI